MLRRPASLLLLAAACARLSGASGPAIEAIEPAGAYRGQAVRVRIVGSGFAARGIQHLGGGGAISDQFTVRIGAVALTDVRQVETSDGREALEATVPADLSPGRHDVEIRDPYGASAVLHTGFVESDQAPPQVQATLLVPARAETGVPFAVQVELRNTGGEAARLVSAELNGAAAASSESLVAPAGALRLQATAIAGSAGAFEVRFRASLVDTVTGLPLPAIDTGGSAMALSPPALTSSMGPLPAAINVGQVTQVVLTVANGGEVDALAVQPALAPDPALTADAVAAQDIPAGGSRSYLLVLRGAAAGPGVARFSATGADALTSAPASAPATQPVSIEVQNRAQLRVTAISAPASVSVGQTFAVVALVQNDGDAAAISVADTTPLWPQVSLLAADAPKPVDGHAQVLFRWRLRAESAGAATLHPRVSGTDANSSSALDAGADVLLQLEVPAALSLQLSAPSRVSTGQRFALTATVHNGGEASLTALRAPAPDCGPAALLDSSPQVPPSVAGGASVALSWQFVAISAGPLTCSAAATGADVNSGAPLQADATATATIQAAAALEITSFTIPATISRGQAFTATLLVKNTGQAAALQLRFDDPTAVGTGGPAVAVVSTPGAQDLAGGATATLVWKLQENGTGPGPLTLSAKGVASDENSAAAVSATGTTQAANVVRPASLQILAVALPVKISRGQTFLLRATMENSGEASATGLTAGPPSASATGQAAANCSATVAPTSVAPGATVAFDWSCTENGAGGGTLAFSLQGSGVDSNSGATIQAAVRTSAASLVQTPAALVVTSVTLSPGTINRGQAFGAQIVVANPGQATAAGVSPALSLTGAGPHATTSSAPAAVSIAGGSSATFSWSYLEDGAGPGSLAFSASASGTDENSGAAISSSAASASLAVQTRATLSGSLSVPAAIVLGEHFPVTFTVSNSGGAGATAVQPAALSISGSGIATVLSGPTPASTAIGGGSSGAFSWTLSADAIGTLQIAASAAGTDVNDGGTRAAASAVSRNIAQQPESSLVTASDPFGGDGTSYASLFSYQGMVYLGPNYYSTTSSPGNTQAGAVRMAPDGSNQSNVDWQLEVNQAKTGGARNTAYLATGVSCRTPGFRGCQANTAQCGPDNESGRALFASGTIAGTEWYLISGASNGFGGSRYLYMTNAAFPAASSGADDLAWVQVQAGQGGATRQLTAARIFQDRVYLGFLDVSASGSSQSKAPILNALVTMPALPGYTAALGTDLINLNGGNLPAIGVLGQPANSGSSQLMIDSLLDFGGSLYAANNGGIARSVGTPTPCASPGCSNWVDATPSAAAWGAKTPVLPDNVTQGAIDPSQRAVPAMVSFGGRIFAARNTQDGPQLWSCNPALAGDSLQCDPADWTLIARNSFGDSQLTQFNDIGNWAITLLVATSAHLYVGFNNPWGVQVYRTALPGAASRADFAGSMGCDASGSSCAGIGGSGLGANVVRLQDAQAFTFSSLEWVYLSGAPSSGPVKVYRLSQ